MKAKPEPQAMTHLHKQILMRFTIDFIGRNALLSERQFAQFANAF